MIRPHHGYGMAGFNLFSFRGQIMEAYLRATEFMEADSPLIREYVAKGIAGHESDLDRAVALYYKVRDDIRYNPYSLTLDREKLKATHTLKQGQGFCVTKALLLSACLRCAGIPARLGFADVRNHLASGRLREIMETDLFVWHGFTEVFLEGKWVKATPAFNLSMCREFGVHPLEFDGRTDSIFHPFDVQGKQHMEYVGEHGSFSELPYDEMSHAYQTTYAHCFEALVNDKTLPTPEDYTREIRADRN